MKKRVLFVVVALLACITSVSAYDFEVDGIYYNKVDDENAAVTRRDAWWHDYSGDVKIPSIVEHDGIAYNVIEIGAYAFSACENLKSVSIPDGVTIIRKQAFGWCSGLTELRIPESVTTIEGNAFTNCYNLTKVVLPESITSIGYGAFDECFKLSSIVLPKGLTKIEGYLFARCTSLRKINIPSGVTSIEELAFYDTPLTSVTVPEGCTSLGFGAFSVCSSLTSIKLPQSLVSIGERVFLDCSELTKVEIPESVVEIGPMAFCQCSKLASINIPNGITRIERQVFYKCYSLTSIDLPDHIVSIGEGAFADCDGLRSIIIPEAVVNIGNGAFSYNSALHSIDLPKGLTRIEDNAFRKCENLTFISIPEGISFIGECAFTDCYKIGSITLPQTIAKIGNYAFQCPNLDAITCFAPTPPEIFENTFYSYGKLHVPSGCKEAYASANYWKNFDIEDDLNSVELGQTNYTDSIITEYNNCFVFSLQDSVLSISGYYTGNPNFKTKLDYSINGHDIFLNLVSDLDKDMHGSAEMQPLVLDVSIEGCTEDYYYIYLSGYYGKTAIVDDYTLHETSFKGYGVRGFVREKPPKTDISTGQKDPKEQEDVDVVCRVRGIVGGGYQQRVRSKEGNVINLEGTYNSQAEGNEDVEATTSLGRLDEGEYSITLNVTDEDDVMPPFSATLTFVVGPTGVEMRSADGNGGDIIFDLQGNRTVTPAGGSIYIVNGKKILFK